MSRRYSIGALVVPLVLGVAMLAGTAQGSIAAADAQTEQLMVIATAFNQERQTCYSAPECPNIEALMDLFSPDPRRTEIQRNNNVVHLEGADALRNDHLRVARSFTGRQLETTAMMVQGRNVVLLQLNWDPGAATPNPFTSVLRIEDGKIAHWVVITP